MNVWRTALPGLLALGAVACGAGDADGPGEEGSRLAAGEAAATAETGTPSPSTPDPDVPGTWTATSSGGTPVTLRVDPPELRAGPVRFEIEVGGSPPGDERPVTIDLVAPEMPMHGIQRYPAEWLGAGRYAVETEIPMEGKWIVYVNLDRGADAAEFGFDAAPGEHGADHQHGGQHE